MPTPALVIAIVCCAMLAAAVVGLLVARWRLTAARNLLAGFMEHGPFLAFMKDAQGRYVYENDALVEHIGRIQPGMRSLLGRTDVEAFSPEEEKSYTDNDRRVVEQGRPLRFDEISVDADGTVRHWSTSKFLCRDERGRPCVAGISIDVTEQRAAFEELARRKALLRRLIEVQENERQALCHDLHDGMMQYAIGAKMLLEAARDESESPTLKERLEAVLECLDRGITEGRQVIRGVRSAVLDDLGLVAAIQDLADQMATLGIAVDVRLDADLDDLPTNLRTTVYRVVQESLANVRKHAGASRGAVEIGRTGDDVQVRVSDAGQGFDVEEARKRGFGLIGMAERVRLAGGTLTIDSRPGAGTWIEARLPIPADCPRPAPAAPLQAT